MKIRILIYGLLFGLKTLAQPANNTCATATPIVVGNGTCNSILYDNAGANTLGNPPTPACWTPNSMSHTVWFSFIATTADIELSSNFGGTLANTQIAVYSGTCGSLTQIACQEDVNTAAGLLHTNVILHGLTPGNTYYVAIDGNGNTTGTFGICAQEAQPLGPPLPVQDCATAQTLCNLGNVSVPDGPGGVGTSVESPSCFGAPGERSSSWYTFTAATNGVLAFTITPNAAVDYDFAVYDTTTSCPGTKLSCNWSGVLGSTGLGCTGIQCNPTINVVAGNTYTILVDRFTANSSAGFTLDFTGTTATFASPNPSFTANTACLGNPTQFTNTTNGNFTYSWNFGDGSTATVENPTHTYSAAGTYPVTLLLTAVPGGCQNQIIQNVTVTPLPTVDAGTNATICPGDCITLSGATNATGGSSAPIVFTNTTAVAIPDSDTTTGAVSTIAVSGISPATVSTGSIVSVCLNITHTWNSDLDIYLQAPNGTRIELSTDNGGIDDNYINTCFSMSATTLITAGASPFTGSFIPEQSFNLFNGSAINGNWQLIVQDDAGGDLGTINNWSISFNNLLPTFSWSPTTGMTNANTLTPTVCPTATTTYTLTANNGATCAVTDTVTISVNGSTTPTFTAVAPICTGATLAALPTTSNNGISGTWSPALNNTATTTYTFTPNAGQCATTTTLTITVNPQVTPAFTAVAPICSGATVAALPTTSNNGISGTWAPALNNTATTTYTFTPNAGQCATTTTLTITVNPQVTPTFTVVAPICAGATLTALPTTSNNGISGTWSPTLNNTATTTYTFTPNTGQCATTTTLTITVNPQVTPTFTAVAPICAGATLSALPTTSNNGISGIWAPALNNTVTTTYTFTPNVGQCATTTTLTITVNPQVTPAFTAVAPICSGATLAALPLTSNNGITGTWSPALNNTATTTYTFTPNSGQCATTTTLTITVNPQVTPTFTAVAPICSGATLAALPTTSNNGISGTWAPALNNTATTTYTFTPTAGQCATTTTLTITVNPQVTPTFTAVAPICSGATLAALPTTSNNGITGTWSPALNNTATTTYAFTPTAGQCATTTTLTITVNPQLTPTFTAVSPICAGATLTALPTTSNNGISGTWSPALNNTVTTTYTFTPNAGQCATTTTLTITVNTQVTPTFTAVAPICAGATVAALPTTSNNGISGTWAPALNNTATTTYTFTPTAGQCATTTTLTITVNPQVTPTFTAVAPICSGATLTALPTTSNNGISGTWAPALNNTATTTYTFTPTAGQCATTTTLTITVNPQVTPTFTAVAPICSGATLAALPTTSNNGITGTWSPALNNTATTTYAFTPTAGQCATTTTLTITVNPQLTPTFTPVPSICSGATLSALPTTSNNGITGTWAPALNNTATTTYTFTPTAGQCATTTTLTITVNPQVTPTFTAVAPICSGATLAALPTTSNNGISGTWVPALNNTATTIYTFTPNAGQCATTTTLTITVNNSNTAPIFSVAAPICSGATLAALPTTSNNGITGTWSPALNNTATTTYTFTPNAGQCATTTTLTITVNPQVTPTFTAVSPICAGATLTALPTTSNNGISGTWAPALNNTATTTYTFTPNAGQCATTTTLTITVNTQVTPTFTAVAPICAGATVAALPTTSNNGISGTWAPALNNTTTTTYTFTPNTGQCATTTTLTITVNPQVTPTFTAVAPICSGATLTALPTTSNNGISGTWAPALNNTTTTTYTFTPNTGQCATTTTLTITVNPQVTPTFAAVAPICAGATLTALPTTSNNGISGTWSPALNNSATTTYTFTPNAGQCATTTTLTITVNTQVTPTFTAVAPICSGATLAALTATSNNGISGTWAPALNNTVTTTYTFTPNAGQCATTTTLTITVNPQVTPIFTAVAPICSGATLAALPTTSNNGISGTWAPALNNTATTTYTFTPNAGQCATTTTLTITVNPQVTPTFTAVAPICSGATLAALPTTSNNGISGTWSPALNNTATTTYTFTPNAGQCATTTTLTITVNPQVTPTFTAVAPICSGATVAALPTTSNNGISGTWAPALNNTSTTTYTFTPNAGQCATTTTLTITVNPQVTPTFAIANQTYCQGSPVIQPLLPTNSSNGLVGTWNPASISTALVGVTTYTFTPSAPCALPFSFTVSILSAPTANTPTPYEVCDDNNDGVACTFVLGTKTPEITTNPNVQVSYHLTPTDAQTGFNPIAPNQPFCNNDFDQQTIYIRVFDPLAPNCPTLTTLSLIVHPKPVAGVVADYALCDDNTDGIAVFNLNAVVTPQVLGSLPAGQHTVTYYTSQADALVPQNALTGTTAYASGSTTLWVRVENTATGCFDVISFALVVNPLPLLPPAGFFPQFEVCETTAPLGFESFNLTTQIASILNGQTGVQVTFYPTLANAQNNTNAIANPTAYTNTIAFNQTIGVALRNTTTGCRIVTTMDLVVNPRPTPNVPTTPYTVCDDNQDGISTFDLNTLTPGLLLGSTTAYTISYHLTQVDAQTPLNAISLTQPFSNNDPFVQIIWVRAEDPNTGCFSVVAVTLEVEPAPIAPLSLPALSLCDTNANTQDGCMPVNLAQQTAAVLALQPLSGSNYTVTYYTNAADASASPVGVNPIVNTSNFTVCNTATLWVRVQQTATGCFAVGSFTVTINTPIVLTTPTLYALCDNDATPNNQFTSFDLVSFVGAVPGHTLAFYLNAGLTQPIANPSAFTNTIAANQTIYIQATNTATGCRAVRTLTVRVLPIPTPRTDPPALAPLCDVTNPGDGLEVLDLTLNAAYILNGQANVSLHYYPSYADALADTNEILTPTAANVGANVWIRVESLLNIDSFNAPCFVLVEQALTVNPLPTLVQPVADYQECDDDTDNITTFNLTAWGEANLLTGNTPPLSNYSLSFYTDAALTQLIANPSSYQNTSNPQTLYVVSVNSTTGCRSVAGTFTILVNPKPQATSPDLYENCDTDGPNDGLFTVDLTQFLATILTGQPDTDFSVSFHLTQSDAQNDANAIANTSAYQASTGTLWIRVENNLTGCARVVPFNFLIERLPEPVIVTDTNSNVICVDFITDQVVRPLTLEVDNNVPGSYTYAWYLSTDLVNAIATGPSYTVDTADPNGATRTYVVVMTSTSDLNCSQASASFDVIQSGQAVVPAGQIGYTVSNAFSDLQTITVTVDGHGTYQYSLDDGPRQDSAVFTDVPMGEHTITVWDTEGGLANSCDPLILSGVSIIDYPHYFTPNGDGINETWNVVGLQNQPAAKIYIFDRYGKLLKQISPTAAGWDGTYNGALMPATDYWFLVEYFEGNVAKEFRAHFSLKR